MSATPGPWGLTTTYPEGQWVLYSKTATGPGEKQSRDVGRFIGSEADARLIAAAPELLSALEAFVDSDNPDSIDTRYENARQAIARATTHDD